MPKQKNHIDEYQCNECENTCNKKCIKTVEPIIPDNTLIQLFNRYVNPITEVGHKLYFFQILLFMYNCLRYVR